MSGIGIGLFGNNGHQLTRLQIEQAGGILSAVCGVSDTDTGEAAVYTTLKELLCDPRVDLVSICADTRSKQAEVIRQAMLAGKHVLAEKPCVMSLAELDELIALAAEKHLVFCEMAGTLLEQPYFQAAEIVRSGMLGNIVQIFVQKSYPYADWRPQEEERDGGLILQCAVYGLRMVEQVAGQTVSEDSLTAIETGYGNPLQGSLNMACTLQMRTVNGGIATVIANYLNQPAVGIWGNEELRIFGTKGFLQTEIRNKSVSVFSGGSCIEYRQAEPASLLEHLIDGISGKTPFPYSVEWLTRPTRLAILAKFRAEGESW